jgi:hypothetical protein
VDDVTRTPPVANLGSEFDRFLFTLIGEERHEMPVSVLSALARSNVDPWEEAAALAQLPKTAATQRLRSIIAALPGRTAMHSDAGTIAAGLIELLPRRRHDFAQPREKVSDVGAMINSRALMYGAFVLMAIMLGAQFIIASYQPPAHVAATPAPLDGAAALRASPPITDR